MLMRIMQLHTRKYKPTCQASNSSLRLTRENIPSLMSTYYIQNLIKNNIC